MARSRLNQYHLLFVCLISLAVSIPAIAQDNQQSAQQQAWQKMMAPTLDYVHQQQHQIAAAEAKKEQQQQQLQQTIHQMLQTLHQQQQALHTQQLPQSTGPAFQPKPLPQMGKPSPWLKNKSLGRYPKKSLCWTAIFSAVTKRSRYCARSTTAASTQYFCTSYNNTTGNNNTTETTGN